MFWNVYLNGKKIDAVSFADDCDKDYVLRSLVNHDGYDSCVTVRRAYALPYKRKTREEWEIQANYGYGHGWECVNTETTLENARRSLKEYRDNEPYPFKIVKKRVKL